jgi:CRISPR system Cascade subunit CasB
MTEASKDSSSRFFWTRFPPGKGVPRGEDLAALRRGVGKEPGSVPEMWRFYSTFRAEGGSSDPKLWAEHHALTLFSIHQQSVAQLVHETGVRG